MDRILQILSFLMSGANDFGQALATGTANNANQGLFSAADEELRALRNRRQGDADAFAGSQNEFATGLRSDSSQGFADISRQLQGLGGQERKDIDRDFGNLSSQTSANAQSRGLTGTTLLPSLQRGVERERTAAQGRLSERLRREQIGVSGAALSSDIGLGMNQLNTRDRGFGLTSSTDVDRTNAIVNFLSGVNNNAPSEANFLNTQQATGSGFAQAPDFPSQSTGEAFGLGALQAGIQSIPLFF